MRKTAKLNNIDFDSMTEEEIDEYYRPRKANKDKSMASLFIYLILQENKGRHLTQVQIQRRLEEEPYCLSLERKAIGRVLHSLDDSFLSVVSTSDDGSWFEEEAAA